MGQEEPLFTVVSSQPEECGVQLAPVLGSIGPESVRYLPPAALETIVLLPHEVLIVDFVSTSVNNISEGALHLIARRPSLVLLPENASEAPAHRIRMCAEVLGWPGEQAVRSSASTR